MVLLEEGFFNLHSTYVLGSLHFYVSAQSSTNDGDTVPTSMIYYPIVCGV